MDKCPLKDDCDLTLAYMAGAASVRDENAKLRDTIAAKDRALVAALSALRAVIIHVEKNPGCKNDGVKYNSTKRSCDEYDCIVLAREAIAQIEAVKK